MRRIGILGAALAAAAGASVAGDAITIRRQPEPPLDIFKARYRHRERRITPPGGKVARSLGHDGGVYHTGALNKDNRASAWARGWNSSAGMPHDERIRVAQAYAAKWAAS